MKILDEIRLMTGIHRVPPDSTVITYVPHTHGSYSKTPEGLFVWWIGTETSPWKFKIAEFVIQTLQLEQAGWWIREQYDDLDWNCMAIEDPEGVELGPYAFAMSLPDFLSYYKPLVESDQLQEASGTKLDVGLDWSKFGIDGKIPPPTLNRSLVPLPALRNKTPPPAAPKSVPKTPTVSFDAVVDPAFPITYKVDGQEFKTLKDVDQYIRFAKLSKVVFEGFKVEDPVKLGFVKKMIQNKDAIINLLKGL